VTHGEDVSLRELTAETMREICRLEVREDQRDFVAPNVFSIAQAYFESRTWLRGVYVGDTPVGFAMLYENPDGGQYFLWRFMIDAQHQGKGYGRAALDLVVDHVRGLPDATELRLSYVEGDASPRGFYRAYGFAETGEREHGEIVMSLAF
jgi:diamine N-acetyltransferase